MSRLLNVCCEDHNERNRKIILFSSVFWNPQGHYRGPTPMARGGGGINPWRKIGARRRKGDKGTTEPGINQFQWPATAAGRFYRPANIVTTPSQVSSWSTCDCRRTNKKIDMCTKTSRKKSRGKDHTVEQKLITQEKFWNLRPRLPQFVKTLKSKDTQFAGVKLPKCFHRNVGKETFELWALSFRKCDSKWDWLYLIDDWETESW